MNSMHHSLSLRPLFMSAFTLMALALVQPGNAQVVSNLVYQYDNVGAAATSWASSGGSNSPVRDWTIGGTSVDVTLDNSPATSTTISSAFNFPGNGSENANLPKFRGTVGSFSGLGANSTFEIWVRPSALMTGGDMPELIFETGGWGRGMSISFWNDNTIHLAAKDTGTVDTDANIVLVSDALSASDVTDFIQIVAVMSDTASGFALYVNPVSSADPDTPDDTLVKIGSDWVGTDGAGLGGIENQLGGGANGGGGGATYFNGAFRTFDGEIGLMRFYDASLTGADVETNFLSVVPEPASGALLAVGGLFLLARRRRAATR
ncbi:MAG: PEP-CTERM sorting domain-containing protein [Verrucomicrobiota bacterium]